MHYHRPEIRPWMHRPSKTLLAMCLCYTLAIVYASLYPLTGWRTTDASVWSFLFQPWPRYWTGFDIVSNIAAYVPLGALVALCIWQRFKLAHNIAIATLLCTALSFFMEIAQHFLPSRVPSWVDTAANFGGGLIGASIAAVCAKRWFESQLFDTLTSRWLRPKPAAALILLLMWLAIQALPQSALFLGGDLPMGIFGLGFEQWREHMQSGYLSLPILIGTEVLTVSLTFFVLTTLIIETTTIQAPRLALGVCLICLALACKVFSATQFSQLSRFHWLTTGAQSGLVVGSIFVLIAAGLPQRVRLRVSVISLLGLIGISNFVPIDSYQVNAAIARQGTVLASLISFLSNLAFIWPWLALLYLLSRKLQRRL